MVLRKCTVYSETLTKNNFYISLEGKRKNIVERPTASQAQKKLKKKKRLSLIKKTMRKKRRKMMMETFQNTNWM